MLALPAYRGGGIPAVVATCQWRLSAEAAGLRVWSGPWRSPASDSSTRVGAIVARTMAVVLIQGRNPSPHLIGLAVRLHSSVTGRQSAGDLRGDAGDPGAGASASPGVHELDCHLMCRDPAVADLLGVVAGDPVAGLQLAQLRPL